MSSAYRDGEPALGRLLSVHADRRGCVLWVVYGLLGACVVGWALLSGIPASLGIMMLVVIAIGIAALRWMSRKNAGAGIELHEHGLVARGRGGIRAIRFDDVRSVTSSRSRRGAAGV